MTILTLLLHLTLHTIIWNTDVTTLCGKNSQLSDRHFIIRQLYKYCSWLYVCVLLLSCVLAAVVERILYCTVLYCSWIVVTGKRDTNTGQRLITFHADDALLLRKFGSTVCRLCGNSTRSLRTYGTCCVFRGRHVCVRFPSQAKLAALDADDKARRRRAAGARSSASQRTTTFYSPRTGVARAVHRWLDAQNCRFVSISQSFTGQWWGKALKSETRSYCCIFFMIWPDVCQCADVRHRILVL